MEIKIGLPPIVGRSPKVLILVSLPGDESLRLRQYYAHPNNQFWRILARVYRKVLSERYDERVNFLAKQGVALWDVLQSAERKGSMDSAIIGETANNISALLTAHPSLQGVGFNGGKAHLLFSRHVREE
jgi:TDG/mug DNA glycosylase family protein